METSFIVTDISYGDAGKGTTVDYLARQAQSAVVVRHSGGAQAAHNVVTPDGRHHTFAQFGSGSFVDDVKTHLSQYMLVNPITMLWEADHLIHLGVSDIWSRLSIDGNAPLILPWHAHANKIREISRGTARHGSTGMGIGEVMMDLLDEPNKALRVRDLLSSPSHLRKCLEESRQFKYEQLKENLDVPNTEESERVWDLLRDSSQIDTLVEDYGVWLNRDLKIVDDAYLQTLANNHESLIFEGSQGVLLDEWYGFHPYTTWSTTTSENALQLLSRITHSAPIKRLGVMRAYTTRHGAGPFVTEDPILASVLPESYNDTGRWTGAFRYGHLDLLAHQYAVAATGGIDELVVTGLDRSSEWKYCTRYVLPETSDVQKFFKTDHDGRATGIRLGIKGNLAYQERLSELLFACSPRYDLLSTVDSRQLLQVIEEALGVSIGLASYGPSATEKRVPVVF